jgi:hypothetical protein
MMNELSPFDRSNCYQVQVNVRRETIEVEKTEDR